MSANATLETDHAVHGIGLYFKIFLALLLLLVATVGASKIHLPGYGNILLAMAIAVVKAVLIVLYFMHMRWTGKLVAVMFLSSVYVLGLGLILIFADYWYR